MIKMHVILVLHYVLDSVTIFESLFIAETMLTQQKISLSFYVSNKDQHLDHQHFV